MGLPRPDESFGVLPIEELICLYCDRRATALEAWLHEGQPGAVWACEEHAQNLSAAGHRFWAIRATCQAVEDDVPCGAVAHWLELVATEDKIRPASLCRRHASPESDEDPS